jgi:hypothetical protein
MLSDIILSKSETLDGLHLDSIKCSLVGHNKEDSDEPSGVLDPLFYAASGLVTFSVSTKPCSNHSTLVSPKALRGMIVEGGPKNFKLWLRGLGLTDNHIFAIVDGLSTPGTHLDAMCVESNPGITDQGYGALLNLVNQDDKVGHSFEGRWIACFVDDAAWEGELNLVSQMNSDYLRLDYMTNGTFTSKERRWQWLERVVNLPISDEDDTSDDDDEDDMDDEDGVHLDDQEPLRERENGNHYKDDDHNHDDEDVHSSDKNKNKKREAKLLNFIWYTLRQNPELMQVSQTPTRFRKRKATGSTPGSDSDGVNEYKKQKNQRDESWIFHFSLYFPASSTLPFDAFCVSVWELTGKERRMWQATFPHLQLNCTEVRVKYAHFSDKYVQQIKSVPSYLNR